MHITRRSMISIVLETSDDVGKQTRPCDEGVLAKLGGRAAFRTPCHDGRRAVVRKPKISQRSVTYARPGGRVPAVPYPGAFERARANCIVVLSPAHDESRVPVGEKRPSLGGAVTIIL